MNREETAGFLNNIRRRYRDDGVCFWAVILKSEETFIGICGILKQFIDGHEEYEVGYRILDTYWGKGYGTEAAMGCIEYAKEKLGVESVIALIRDVNKQSIRVAEKCGLYFERETMFCGLPHRVYRIRFQE